jgi:integration host factor subunit beta
LTKISGPVDPVSIGPFHYAQAARFRLIWALSVANRVNHESVKFGVIRALSSIKGAGFGLIGKIEEMIRSQLVQKLAMLHPDLSVQEVDRIVDIVFDSIGGRLADGGRVELRGFGAFTTRSRGGRTGRNPRTGAAVVVPAKRVPHFKPGKEMRVRLNAS